MAERKKKGKKKNGQIGKKDERGINGSGKEKKWEKIYKEKQGERKKWRKPGNKRYTKERDGSGK